MQINDTQSFLSLLFPTAKNFVHVKSKSKMASGFPTNFGRESGRDKREIKNVVDVVGYN